MNFSGLNYIDYSYLIILIIFAVFFGIKGATKSISYSLKIILSISLPFIFHKRVLNFSLEKLNIEYLLSLQNKNAIFLEIITFIILFFMTYIIYSILEKALNIKSPPTPNKPERTPTMALSKSISTGLIKTWAIGKKTSIKYKNLKYYLFKSNKSSN